VCPLVDAFPAEPTGLLLLAIGFFPLATGFVVFFAVVFAVPVPCASVPEPPVV
jgi:hypothetical protein